MSSSEQLAIIKIRYGKTGHFISSLLAGKTWWAHSDHSCLPGDRWQDFEGGETSLTVRSSRSDRRIRYQRVFDRTLFAYVFVFKLAVLLLFILFHILFLVRGL